jgi:hypothetical protein
MRRITLLTILLALATGSAHAGPVIKSVRTYGGYQTGGVHVAVNTTATLCTARIYVDGRETHPAISYDLRNLAASIFGLEPGRSYAVRVDVAAADGVSDTTGTVLATRPEWALDTPLRERVCETTTALVLALKAALPGDRIILQPGEYRGEFTLARPVNYTPGPPIEIVGAAEVERTRIIGTGMHGIRAFIVNGLDSVTFYNLDVDGMIEFQRSTRGSVVRCNISCDRAPTAGDIGLVTFRRHHQITAPVNPAICGHLVQDCTITGRSGVRNVLPYYGILLGEKPGEGATLRRNVISRFGGDGIQCAGGTLDEVARPQVAVHSANVLGLGAGQWPGAEFDVYENTITDCGDDAIEADGWAVNLRIFGNRLTPRGMHPITTAKIFPGPVFIVRNTMTDFFGSCLKTNNAMPGQTRNIYAYHNTWYKTDNLTGSGHTDTFYLGHGSENWNLVFRNNIVVNTGDYKKLLVWHGGSWNVDFDYNLWHNRGKLIPNYMTLFEAFLPYYDPKSTTTQGVRWRSKYERSLFGLRTWTQMPATWEPYIGRNPSWPGPDHGRLAFEPHGIEKDPLLGPDLRPMPGSPAIDRGVVIPGINDYFAGGGPDLGALEIPQETPTPSPLPAPVTFEHAGERWTTTAPADWTARP